MAVYQDKNNKWMASISYYYKGKRRHTIKRGFNSKREASRYELEFKDHLTDNTVTKSATFHDAVNSFLREKSTNRKKSTTDEIERICNKYFASLFNTNINKLQFSDFQQIKDQLIELDLAVSYKNKILTILKGLSNYISLHYDSQYIADRITKFRSNKVKEETKVWTLEEFNLFISYVDKEIYRDLFTILLNTGARIGEMRALYKSDYKDHYLLINKSLRHAKDGITTPKTPYSNRRIKLDPLTENIILKYTVQKGKYMLGNETPLAESTVGRAFRHYIARIQKNHPDFPTIRLHDLRHSHATILINNGANIVAVSKRLGHASVDITLKIYTHLLNESESNLVKIMETLNS